MESQMEQRQYDECKSCLKNIDTIDRLTEQLAEANKHKQDWHNMYQETYDQLVAVNRELECYKIQFEKDYSESDIEMIMRLSCQLAERDAEIERLSKYCKEAESGKPA